MNLLDYMNFVAGYIINKLENKKDFNTSINFSIKPKRDLNTNDLYYEIEEKSNDSMQLFYLKVPCVIKEDFYVAVNNFLIEYIKNSDLLVYSAITADTDKKEFSVVTKNRASITFFSEDKKDFLVFEQFKNYLNENLIISSENNSLIADDEDDLLEVKDKVVTLSKIRL